MTRQLKNDPFNVLAREYMREAYKKDPLAKVKTSLKGYKERWRHDEAVCSIVDDKSRDPETRLADVKQFIRDRKQASKRK